jgi:uncharacterized protein (DUF1697 family)
MTQSTRRAAASTKRAKTSGRSATASPKSLALAARTYVALLRGINVGTANRVAMLALRNVLSGVGFAHVRTLLASGNVVFNSVPTPEATLAEQIEAAVSKHLNVETRAVVLTLEQLDALVAGAPLRQATQDSSRLLVACGITTVELKRLQPLTARDWSPEQLTLTNKAAYAWCPNGISVGELAEAMFAAIGKHATTRNIGTLVKLQALARE